MNSNTSGTHNSAFGFGAMWSNLSGSYNTGVGISSLYSNETGSHNVGIGVEAGDGNMSGSYNVAVGDYSSNSASGSYNTVIGSNSGLGYGTGSYNTIIGANVWGLSSSIIGNIIIADGYGNRRINVDGSGNVGIGTTTPSSKLTVNDGNIELQSAGVTKGYFWWDGVSALAIGPGTLNNSLIFKSNNVGIGTAAAALSYTLQVNGSLGCIGSVVNISDARFKKDVHPISDALAIVEALRGVTYNWDQTADPTMKLDERNHVGFIAQEVEAVLPQAVSTASDARQTKSVAYSEVIPVLTEAIKQQQSQIDALTDENDTLKAQNAAILQRLEALEAK